MRAVIDRVRGYFLTQEGRPRGEKFGGTGFSADDCTSEAAWKRHRQAAAELSPAMADAIRAFRRDLNVIPSRGVWRIFGVALSQHRQTLDARALLDFSGVLERAVRLLKDMDELPRAATSSKHATVMCSSTSSRTRAGRNGTWWRNWSGAGVQASARPQTRSSVHLHRRRSKAIDLRLPRRGCGVLDEAAGFVDAFGRKAMRAGYLRQLPGGAGAAGVRQRRV